MTDWSPPRLPRSALAVGTVLWLAWFAYCVLIIQQVLLGIFPAILFVTAYIGWRILAAFEAIADAQQRLAAARERDQE